MDIWTSLSTGGRWVNFSPSSLATVINIVFSRDATCNRNKNRKVEMLPFTAHESILFLSFYELALFFFCASWLWGNASLKRNARIFFPPFLFFNTGQTVARAKSQISSWLGFAGRAGFIRPQDCGGTTEQENTTVNEENGRRKGGG